MEKTRPDQRVTRESVALDGGEYTLYHLLLFAGTAREVRVTAADWRLEDKIDEMIRQERYPECRGIDERYAYWLPSETDLDNDDDIIESIEDVYED